MDTHCRHDPGVAAPWCRLAGPARDRRLQILALFGYFLVLMAVTVAYGIRHDYVTYALLWDNILAGGDL